MSKVAELSHFFAFLSRMKYIDRWSLMRNTDIENIAEHSLQVAMIAHALCVIRNIHFGGSVNADRAATLAMYHDSSEILTGDMPTPVKYFNPQIMDAYRQVEDVSKNKLLSMLPAELRPVYAGLFFKEPQDNELWIFVKAADKLCAYIKCIEELRAGNQEFKKAAESTRENVHQLDLPEVEYFLDTFMKSFELTLDEQD